MDIKAPKFYSGFSRHSRYIFWFLLCVVITIGIYARFNGLSWHFSHADDAGVAKSILEVKQSGKTDLFIIPKSWSFAPLQFLFTQLLINTEQPYRELMFWARLPSALFSCMTLLLFVLFYYQSDRLKSAKSVLALTLLACSLEHIIFAKQMNAYAAGVFSSTLLLVLFFYHLNKKSFSLKQMLVTGLVFTLLTNAQYQSALFAPAFFLTLFVYGLWNQQKFWSLSGRFLAGGLTYVGTFWPTYHWLMWSKNGIIAWAWGPAQEFRYDPSGFGSFFEKIKYTVWFFTKSLMPVYESMVAFIPEEHTLFFPAMFFLFLLFVIGWIGFLSHADSKIRFLGIFFSLVFATWLALMTTKTLSLSPTRHSVILLPLFAMATANGLPFLLDRLDKALGMILFSKASNFLLCLFSLSILSLFIVSYGPFFEYRKDVFIEEEIRKVIEERQVDSMLLLKGTHQASVMNRVREQLAKNADVKRENKNYHPYINVAIISRQENLTPTRFQELVQYHNQLLKKFYSDWPRRAGEAHPLDRWPYEYKVVYSKEEEKDVQIEFSKKTWNGINAIYFYVIRRDVYP